MRVASVERSTGEMLIGPPKPKAGRRVVGVPGAIITTLRDHLAVFVKDEPGALVFPGVKGGPSAMIYQRAARGADQPINALSTPTCKAGRSKEVDTAKHEDDAPDGWRFRSAAMSHTQSFRALGILTRSALFASCVTLF